MLFKTYFLVGGAGFLVIFALDVIFLTDFPGLQLFFMGILAKAHL